MAALMQVISQERNSEIRETESFIKSCEDGGSLSFAPEGDSVSEGLLNHLEKAL